MKFSLKHLFVAIFIVALLCTTFPYAPTATLSVILLGSLPAVVFTAFRLHSRRNCMFCLLLLGPFATYAFYVGMLGPLAAVATAPDEWGFVQTQTVIFDFLNWAYTPNAILTPFLIFDPQCETTITRNVLELLENYQKDWMSLVGADLN